MQLTVDIVAEVKLLPFYFMETGTELCSEERLQLFLILILRGLKGSTSFKRPYLVKRKRPTAFYTLPTCGKRHHKGLCLSPKELKSDKPAVCFM